MFTRQSTRLSHSNGWCKRISSSSSVLARSTASIHHSSTRLIQSLAFVNTPLSGHISHSSSHSSCILGNTNRDLFYTSRRRFTYPDHEVVGLPALSPSVEESKIVSWKKNEGDLVSADEAIAIVQTDKAELDWQVTDDVYLAKILLEPGQTVPVGTPACIFVEDAADVSAFKNYTGDASASASAPEESKDDGKTSTEPPPASAAIDTSKYPEFTMEGMPALSPTATDGAVVQWLVKEGDFVEEGTGVAEIQTDKSVVTWNATDEAYVAKLLVPADADSRLAVGEPLAVFVENQADVAAFKDFDAKAATAPPPSTSSSTPSTPPPSASTSSTPSPPPDAPSPSSKSSPVSSGGLIFASPYAKKLAKELGLDLSTIGTPTGDGGTRIVAADVIKASASTSTSTSSGAPTFIPLSGERTFEDIPVSAMRDIIGKRLSESKFTSPHFYVTMECILDNLISMRTDMNDGLETKISVNDLVIKACAAALRDTPSCNVGWIVDKQSSKPVIRQYNYVDISVAVATPTGLITPIIKDADRKPLTQISAEMKDLAKRAKDNKLALDEFQGGTFTISNMGMFGVTNFTAIINPPQACILAVGGAKQKLVADDGPKGFKTVSTMEITLSSDHRSVDGALAATLINNIKKYIERPSKLLL